MKKILVLTFVFLGLCLRSQTTCQTAQPFCAGGVSGVYYPATTNQGNAQTGPFYGCLGTTPNPAWYYLQIASSGNLDILIQGQTTSLPPGPGQDVDFICWGPFSSLANACNSLTSTYTIDCSYSTSFTETLNIPSGVTGEYYLVLITNFANVQQNILFNQFGGTGTTNCSLVSGNYNICYGSSITLTVNTPSGLSNVSYALSPGGVISQTPSFTVSPQTNTSYTIIATGTNTSNVVLTQTAVANVTVNPIPLVTPTIVNSTCTNTLNSFNLGLHFGPATATPAYTVAWAPAPNVVTTATQVSGNGGITGGTYNATIVAAGGCSTSTSFTIDSTPAGAEFSLSPSAGIYSITCYQPTINISASNASDSYTWTHGTSAPINGPSITIDISGMGNWTVNAVHQISGCVASRTFAVAQNTLAPTCAVTPTFQNITCSLSSITMVTLTASPTINISHQITAPAGVTLSINSPTGTYFPGAGDGIYTDCAVNLVNGCSTCKTFTVVSSQGYPTVGVVSPQNFTLGCGTKSFAIVDMVNGNTTNPGAGPVTYTALAPGVSTVLPPGWTGNSSTFTTTIPGPWIFIIKDQNSGCETRLPLSILDRTDPPGIASLIIPQQVLNCNVPKVTLDALSLTPNVSYNWRYPDNTGTPVNLASNTVAVSLNPSKPTSTLISNYTLSITDNNNHCITNTVIPMLQNTFPPKALITSGQTSISCSTQSLTLSNGSSSGIPATSGFPNSLAAIGYLWEGPSPQTPDQLATTYIARVPGKYVLTTKDLNNGCTAQFTMAIGDDRQYPQVNSPNPPPPSILDCGSAVATITAVVAGDQSSFSYTWAAPAEAVTGDVYSKVFRTPTLGVYKVVVLNTKNGCASSGQYTVVNGKLSPGFEPDQTSGFAPLTVSFTNTSRSTLDSAKINSLWSFGNGTTLTTKYAGVSPSTVYNLAGTYTVSLFTSKGSCLESTTRIINVDLPSGLTVPNIFTPNGDNVNDLFFLKSTNLTYISVVIYDRWGHLIYEVKTDKGNIAWDGKNQYGKDVAEGTYFYLLKAVGKDEQPYDKRGTITLIR